MKEYKPIKNLLPPAVAEEIKSLFDRLRSDMFLPACEQNETKTNPIVMQFGYWHQRKLTLHPLEHK